MTDYKALADEWENADASETAPNCDCLGCLAFRNHDAIIAALRLAEVVPEVESALAPFIEAVTAHVNEHGGGGYVLARLSDARDALKALQSAKAPT